MKWKEKLTCTNVVAVIFQFFQHSAMFSNLKHNLCFLCFVFEYSSIKWMFEKA